MANTFGIGQPAARIEDPRLLTGQGRFVDDIALAGQACAVVLRSPHAHALIRAIDTESAKRTGGVLPVLTGADAEADGLGGLPGGTGRPEIRDVYAPRHKVLLADRVRHVGDRVNYEILPSVTSLAAWAARRLVRPVKWVAERGESMISDTHARDRIDTGERAFDRDGNILAVRMRIESSMGAYISALGAVPPLQTLRLLFSVYAIYGSARAYFTHTNPMAVNRGGGADFRNYAGGFYKPPTD